MRLSLGVTIAGAALAAHIASAASFSRLSNIAPAARSLAISNITLGRSLSAALHVRGTVGLDEPCVLDSECTTGFCSLDFRAGVYWSQLDSKRCTLVPFGGPCAASSDCGTTHCNNGRCDYDPTPAKACRIPIDCPSGACASEKCWPSPGETCDPEIGCPAECDESTNTCGKLFDNFFCRADDQCQSGRCAAPLHFCGFTVPFTNQDDSVILDEQCTESRVCIAPSFGQTCDPGVSDSCNSVNLQCDPATSTCGKLPVGARCHWQSECISQACGSSPYFVRRDDICIARPHGADCTTGAQCGSGSCISGQCGLGGAGSPCFWNADCASKKCNTTRVYGDWTCAAGASETATSTSEVVATSTATISVTTADVTTASTGTSTASASASSTSLGSPSASTSTPASSTSTSATSTSSTSTTSKSTSTTSLSFTPTSTTTKATSTSAATTSKPATASMISTKPTSTSTSASTSSKSTVTASTASTSTSTKATATTTSSSASKASTVVSGTSKTSATSTGPATSKTTSTSATSTKLSTSTSTSSTTSKATASATSTSTKATSSTRSTSKAASASTKTTSTSTTTSKPTSTPTPTPTALPIGAPCDVNAWCQSGYCRAKLNPDGTRQTQAYCDVKKASGANCYQNAGCLSGFCVIPRGATSGTCS